MTRAANVASLFPDPYILEPRPLDFGRALEQMPFVIPRMTDVPLTDLESQPTAASTSDGGKYVYCIIRSDRQHDFGSIGIGGGQRVMTVAYRDLAAVVSDTPIVI